MDIIKAVLIFAIFLFLFGFVFGILFKVGIILLLALGIIYLFKKILFE
jgi:hypothetical protein